MSKRSEIASAARFALFRERDAVNLEESGIMTSADGEAASEIGPMTDMGVMDGARNDLLFCGAGFSLVKIWFKSGFPLPRHSHDSDCLYYIIAGSVRMGDNELGPGDGFFVGADVPYAYVAGDEGVELLEFRAAEAFDIRMLVNNPKWWEKAAKTFTDRAPIWADEIKPSEKVAG